MFTQFLTALLRRNDDPPEYVQLDSLQSTGARSVAGVCGITPSGKHIIYLKNDTVHIRKRAIKKDTCIELPNTVPHGINGTSITCMALSEDSAFLGCVDGSIFVVSLITDDITIANVRAFERGDCITALSVEGSFVLAASSSANWGLFRYDSESNSLHHEAQPRANDRNTIKAVSLCPQNPAKGLLAIGSLGSYVDLYSDQPICTLRGHGDSIRACAVQNELGITGSFDMSARVSAGRPGK